MGPKYNTGVVGRMSLQNEEGQNANHRKRPVITPDSFNGDSADWDTWIGHFDSVAQVNDWDDPGKLLWLQVCLTGKAWNRLRDKDKEDYARAKMALWNRFEPDSHRDLYTAEFQMRCHRQREIWGCLADNLRQLADKGFLELDNRAKEQLRLDWFLSLIEDSDAALAVHQRHPKDLNDAVACVLEIKAYLG